ncbi:MAG: D-aminoacyl-tRNA deacylase [Desulfobacterales bacterium]|nr:D-aminoacyl-tRNA deacylase [Desulfobacterales bacterium]MDD4072053.1 D-aminoacyl-tRNA deacylase [Desulfobacterales bacterium]MDD4393999.1 D-aminoacyl-tRNA deacylase [Desulfobacterales bacterium]
MRAVIQRVKHSCVTVNGETVGEIRSGLLVLLGVAAGDTESDAIYLADKIARLRIFEDENGKMNLSILETGGSMLVVSQFTLLGDCRKGRRPSFAHAAPPNPANTLYEYFITLVRENGIGVETGIFGAMMEVSLVNDGPVTLIVESRY